jgi:hypothetical protein
MATSLVFVLFGFVLGVISLGTIMIVLRSKDEALIQDLLDRITAHTPGDYLSMIHFRNQHLKQKPGLLFEALKKKTGSKIPTVAEIEMDKAKRAASMDAKLNEVDEDFAFQKEFEAQQKLRENQKRDTVIA